MRFRMDGPRPLHPLRRCPRRRLICSFLQLWFSSSAPITTTGSRTRQQQEQPRQGRRQPAAATPAPVPVTEAHLNRGRGRRRLNYLTIYIFLNLCKHFIFSPSSWGFYFIHLGLSYFFIRLFESLTHPFLKGFLVYLTLFV